MPQLDIAAYNTVNYILIGLFWLYFAIVYIAASYTVEKIIAGSYFKFSLVLVALVIVLSIKNLSNAAESNTILVEKNASESTSIVEQL